MLLALLMLPYLILGGALWGLLYYFTEINFVWLIGISIVGIHFLITRAIVNPMVAAYNAFGQATKTHVDI